ILYSRSLRRSLFRLRSHCALLFTPSFCKSRRIIRRRSDTRGACYCLSFRSARWAGGLLAVPICSFREKHFGEPSRCSRHSVSCSTCSLATLSSFSQIKRRRSVAKYPQWVVRFRSRNSSSISRRGRLPVVFYLSRLRFPHSIGWLFSHCATIRQLARLQLHVFSASADQFALGSDA